MFPDDVNPEKPVSSNTILFALYMMGYRGRMTGHGFRGVASTILHENASCKGSTESDAVGLSTARSI